MPNLAASRLQDRARDAAKRHEERQWGGNDILAYLLAQRAGEASGQAEEGQPAHLASLPKLVSGARGRRSATAAIVPANREAHWRERSGQPKGRAATRHDGCVTLGVPGGWAASAPVVPATTAQQARSSAIAKFARHKRAPRALRAALRPRRDRRGRERAAIGPAGRVRLARCRLSQLLAAQQAGRAQ